MWDFFFGIMTIHKAYIYKIVLWTTFLALYQTFIPVFYSLSVYIFKEYMQWSLFHDLEINFIQLNMKVKSGRTEVKNSLVWAQFKFSKRKINCNLEVLTMKVKRDDNVGNQLDLSGFSSDKEENDEIEDAVWNTVSDDKPTDAAESALIFVGSRAWPMCDLIKTNIGDRQYLSRLFPRDMCLRTSSFWGLSSWTGWIHFVGKN